MTTSEVMCNVSQKTLYFPTFTVEETLKFAVTTRTLRDCIDTSREQFDDEVLNVLTTIFGLRHTLSTLLSVILPFGE